MEFTNYYKQFIEFLNVGSWKTTLNQFILESIKILKVQELILFFRNSQDNLIPYTISESIQEVEKQFAKYCFENQISNYFNLKSELSEQFNLTQPYMTYLLSTSEGKIGIVLTKNPATHSFFENDFNLLKTIFSSFAQLIHKTIFYNENLYIPFYDSLLHLLEDSHLLQANQDLMKKLYSVLEVSNVINSSKKLEDMIQNVLKSATKVLRVQSGSVFLVDFNTGELVFDILSDNEKLKGIRIPKGKGIVGKCAETRQPMIVNDVRTDPDFYGVIDEISNIVTRNLMACPLVVNGEVIGVIEVINTIDRKDFSKEDMELFKSFSDSVAIAIQRRRLIDYIEEANLQLEQNVRELTTLHNIAQILVEYQDIQIIADKVLETIQKELKINRLSFILFDSNTKKFKILAYKGMDLKDYDISPKLLRYVFEKRIPFYIKNFQEVPEIQHLISPERYRSKTAIILPLLKSNSQTFAVLCATEPQNKEIFEQEDFRILLTIGSQISKAYESIEFSGIQKEIEITAKIQKNILPNSFPEHRSVEIFAKAIPAKTTGGDFFDYYMESPYGDIFFIIADVSGKSLPAALFMAVSNSILRTLIRKEKDPSTILFNANELLYEESESGMFVTVFLARYDIISGKLIYSSAGHNNMLLIHKDNSYEILSCKGMPLGVVKSKENHYQNHEIYLKKDDLLVLYTDGVTESVNLENKEYGLEKFLSIILQNKDQKLEMIAEDVYKDILEFTGKEVPDDDFTLFLARFKLNFHDHTYKLKVSAEKKVIPKFINEISLILQKYSIQESDLNDILLVCDEIATNICFYAYKEKTVLKPTFKCKIEILPDQYVKILFVDNGIPYDFYNVKKPDLEKNLTGEMNGGFGIYLVQKIMDKTVYKYLNNKNYLLIVKKLKTNFKL
ncbi:MAG: SpoIIE family protein phosphatase [Leptonema sp. (in: bacteria)]